MDPMGINLFKRSIIQTSVSESFFLPSGFRALDLRFETSAGQQQIGVPRHVEHVERSETAEGADLLHEYIQKDPQGG